MTNWPHKKQGEPIRAKFSLLVGNSYQVIIEAQDLTEAQAICEQMDPREDQRAHFVEASRALTFLGMQHEQKTAGNIIDEILDTIHSDGEDFTDADVIENIQQILKGYEG